MKNWQLFKRHKRTDKVSKAHKSWIEMTEDEARATARAYLGVYEPIFYYFAAPIDNYI